ncbi:hypothetical protein ZWY2020_000513 [Hordeum vulgare]|nr:hypothetical protein ZWY2020_000513 [Hordeum vulgare]
METIRKIDSTVSEIPDHLVEEIFLRLSSPQDLARTFVVCVAFRGLVTTGSFLRRFRRLHVPPLLGFLALDGFHPALPPHPSVPAAHVLTLAADFTFSFLPSHCQWTVQDTRDGRVLLKRKHGKHEEDLTILPELVVCDPLHRRYVLLPPVPDDLASLVENKVFDFFGHICQPNLIPPSDAETDETAFRVI